MLTLLAGSWPTIMLGLTAIIGVVFGLFKHQAAQISDAKAATSDAKAQDAIGKLEAVSADQKAAQAAQQVVTDATAGRATIEADIAAKPAADVKGELRENFSRD